MTDELNAQQESKDNSKADNLKRKLYGDFVGLSTIAILVLLYFGCIAYALSGPANKFNIVLGFFSAMSAVILIPFVVGGAVLLARHIYNSVKKPSEQAQQNIENEVDKPKDTEILDRKTDVVHRQQSPDIGEASKIEASKIEASKIDASKIAEKIAGRVTKSSEDLAKEIETNYKFFQTFSKLLKNQDSVILTDSCRIEIVDNDYKVMKIKNPFGNNRDQECLISFKDSAEGGKTMLISIGNKSFQDIRTLGHDKLRQLQLKISEIVASTKGGRDADARRGKQRVI